MTVSSPKTCRSASFVSLGLFLATAAVGQQPASSATKPPPAAVRLGDYAQHTDMAIRLLRGVGGQRRIVLVCDVSDSMGGDALFSRDGVPRIDRAEGAYQTLVRNAVYPGDRMTVIWFGDTVERKLTDVARGAATDPTIAAVAPGRGALLPAGRRGTNVYYADHLAIQRALSGLEPGERPCVVLISDGYNDPVRAAPDSPATLREAAANYAQYNALSSPGRRALERDARKVCHIAIGDETGILLALTGMAGAQRLAALPPAGRIMVEVFDALTRTRLEGTYCTLLGPDDSPLPGQAHQTYSDQQGRAELRAIPEGTYTLQASRDGYQTVAEHDVIVNRGVTAAVQVLMERPFEFPLHWYLVATFVLLLIGPWRFVHKGRGVWTLGVVPLPCYYGAAQRILFRLRIIPRRWRPRPAEPSSSPDGNRPGRARGKPFKHWRRL